VLDTLLQQAAPLLAAAFTLWGSPVTWLEIVAFVLSVAMVLLNLRVNPLAWPLAIASSLLYALLFASSKLYGEASLQFVFVVVSVWGWWQWLRAPDVADAHTKVGWMRAGEIAVASAATAAAWPVLAWLLGRTTDSDVPWLDALPTVASITGQVLLGLKRVENWPVWLAVNIFSVGLFAYKGLWLTVLLYAVFALLSVIGWRAWRRQALGG
jgi:nicotinamide mononucleotide transporter